MRKRTRLKKQPAWCNHQKCGPFPLLLTELLYDLHWMKPFPQTKNRLKIHFFKLGLILFPQGPKINPASELRVLHIASAESRTCSLSQSSDGFQHVQKEKAASSMRMTKADLSYHHLCPSGFAQSTMKQPKGICSPLWACRLCTLKLSFVASGIIYCLATLFLPALIISAVYFWHGNNTKFLKSFVKEKLPPN